MTGYTAHYWFERINDEDGFAYECLHNGRVIFEGWCRGKKSDAELEVRRRHRQPRGAAGDVGSEGVVTAQILRITPDEYHARDGLSSSVAKVIVERSPAHAKFAHRKNPTKEMDRGSVVHRLVLGKGAAYEVLPFDSYRTNAAKDARDKARADGKVPILEEAFAEANAAAEAVRVQLAERGINLDGESELAIEWTEQTEYGPVLCRCMMDHLWLADGRVLDLKITSNAAPTSIERNAENMGYAIQEAAYRRALTALEPGLAGRVDFLFAFVEAEDIYAMNLCRGDGLFRELGERRWLRAVSTWAECLKNNHWPAYGAGINPLTAPAWALAREEYV